MIADHVGRPRSGPRPAESLGGTMSGRCRISAACAALALLAGPAAALPPVAPPSGPVEAKAESAPAPVAAPRVQPPGPGRPAGVPPPAPARPGELPRDTTRAPPNERDFFGRSGQFLHNELYTLRFDLFHGDAAFKPMDWRVVLTPAFNLNILSVQELAVVNPDVRKGTIRERTWLTLQEWFTEYKIADLSPEYDFLSVRVGSQPFVSDFRGFIFSDINRGVRLFGNLDGNRTQYNLAYFRQQEKDTNSQLNTFNDRNQNIAIANVYRQDFLFPGYTAQASVHYNNDGPDILFDKNGFLVRPDPAGVFQPHRIEAYYLGWTGDGHIGRYNINHAFYWVVGRDSRNPIANTPQSINAQMAALELSYDRDWARFRVSGFYQSGDG